MSTLFGGGGQSSQQKQLTGIESQIAQYGLSQAKQTIPEATSGLESSLNFFSTLLSGDRNAIAAAEAPDISNIQQQYATARQTTDEFAPRGGGATAANAEAPSKEAASIAQLFTGARTTGAEGTAEVAGQLAGLSTGELGLSSSTAGSTFSQLESSQENQQQQQAAAGQAIGQMAALLAFA